MKLGAMTGYRKLKYS